MSPGSQDNGSRCDQALVNLPGHSMRPILVHETLALRPPACPQGTDSHGRMDQPNETLSDQG